jgi:hypothetical protein
VAAWLLRMILIISSTGVLPTPRKRPNFNPNNSGQNTLNHLGLGTKNALNRPLARTLMFLDKPTSRKNLVF